MRSSLLETLPPVLLVASELFVVAFALGWAVLLPFLGAALAKLAAAGVGTAAAAGGGSVFLRHALRTAHEGPMPD